MIDKYNFEATDNGTKRVILSPKEWIIDIRPKPNLSQREYAPARDFYMIYKEYYTDGTLKSEQKYLGNVSIGYTKYYDEYGNLKEIVDEDKKFGKIKPKDIVNIMEEIGLFNRKTGENIVTGNLLKTDGSFYLELIRKINIYFNPAQYGEKGDELSPPQWIVSYLYYVTQVEYIINGDTGEYQKYENRIELIE